MTIIGRFMRRLLPRSLFGRTFLITVLPVALLLTASTYVFYARHWDALSGRLAQNLAGEIDLLARLVREGNPEDPAIRERLIHAKRTLGISLEFLSQDSWASIVNIPVPKGMEGLRDELALRLGYPFRVTLDSSREEIDIFIAPPDAEVMHFSTTRKRLYSPTNTIYLFWTVGLSAVLILLALLFLNNQIRPIRTLARAAAAFGRGQPPRRLPLHGATEVRAATHALNEMQERIQRQMQQRTEMLSGISHDLRTPLTRLRLNLSMLGPALPAADAAAMLNDLGEMEQMINAYLAFARGEEGEEIETMRIDEFLLAVIQPLQRQGQAIGIPDTLPSLKVSLRPAMMRRCLNNLLANADRYADSVNIRVTTDVHTVDVHIDDDGPGIPESEREAVFRPFHRLEPSRNVTTGGVGLGLSIARDIARSHGGDVVLGTSPEGGLRATVQVRKD